MRAKLWMPTVTAVFHNSRVQAFYDRLIARGKPAKLALVASMRKLLTAIYSVAKSHKPFAPLKTLVGGDGILKGRRCGPAPLLTC